MSNTGALRENYFDGRVSPADEMLREGIRRGVVPPTCLLGGYMVMAASAVGEDPCVKCDGPREKCGGRPREKDETEREARPTAWPAHVMERRSVDTPAVRAEVRKVVVDSLKRLTQEALEQEGDKNG